MDTALERLVWQRAKSRCEYCQLPQAFSPLPHAIDHIIARQHLGPTTAENLALACFFWRGHPAIINPSDTSHVRRKTDRLDAEKLARHSLHGLWRESWMAPDAIQELRVLANQRSKLVAERSRLTNRINGDLLRFGHTIGQVGKINGPVVRALIEDFCTNGSVSTHRDHFSEVRIPAGVISVFDLRWKRIDALDQEIKFVEKLCMQQVDALTWRIGGGRTASGCQLRSNLQSIPGVGTQTVTTWLAEVGDITRFGSVNKLLAYAGVDPSGQISAGKVTGTKPRKGNARLHGALRQAARAMLSRAPSCKFARVEAPWESDPEVEAHIEGGPGGCDVQRIFRERLAPGGGLCPTRWALPRFGSGGRSGSCRSHVRRQESPGMFTTPNRSHGR